MRVLLLTDDLLTGGIAKHLCDLVQYNTRSDITYFVAATPGDYLSRFPGYTHFIPLTFLKENSFKKNITGIIPSYYHLSDIVRREKIDLIHSHKRYSHLIGKLLSHQHDIPHITSYHTDIEGMRLFTLFGDYTTCCSHAVRDLLLKKYACSEETSRTIHYGINPFTVRSEAKNVETLQQLRIMPGKRIISSVGQFIHVKDRETLIRAIAIVKKKINTSELLFILLGYGVQLSKLKAMVKELQISDSVMFVDGNSDVEGVMNVSEFMVLNSLREGFGIVLLESASIGKIHIGTRVGGIPEFIEHGETGLLVEPGNPYQLADAIHFLLLNSAKRIEMEAKAKIKYEKLFGLGRMLKEIYMLYDKVGQGLVKTLF